MQSGDDGLVISPRGNYTTAFFEAFPRNPDTFIRGEGTTVGEAEDKAWEKYQRIIVCDHVDGFDRRGYRNGLGFCKKCGMSKSHAFEPLTRCAICDTPTYHTSDIDDKWYCKDHAGQKPVEKWTEADKFSHQLHEYLKNKEQEEKND